MKQEKGGSAMKKLAWALLAVAVVLAGCSANAFDQKRQLTSATQTVVTQTAAEKTAIKAISDAATAFPSTVQTAYAAAPEADLTENEQVAALITKRETAAKKLQTATTSLQSASTTLTKLNAQKNAKAPSTALKTALSSLKLARLDLKTFNNYYDELTSAEKTFFQEVEADPTNQSAVDAALTRYTAYTSALSQQADIITANLQTLATDAQTLLKAVNRMD